MYFKKVFLNPQHVLTDAGRKRLTSSVAVWEHTLL